LKGASEFVSAQEEEEEEDGGSEDEEDVGGGAARAPSGLRLVKGEEDAGVSLNEAGEAMEPFHLRDERDEGHYDASGNYVWRKKTAEDFDPWLAEVDAMTPAERARLAAAGGRGEEEAEGEGGEPPAEDLPPAARMAHLACLRAHVRGGAESVAGALRRLGALAREAEVAAKAARAQQAAGASAQAAAGMGADAARRPPPPPPVPARAAFNAVTEAADALLSNGLVDIYSQRRAGLLMELNDACLEAGLPPQREEEGGAGDGGRGAAGGTLGAAHPGGAVGAVHPVGNAGSAHPGGAAGVAHPAGTAGPAQPSSHPPGDDTERRWVYCWADEAPTGASTSPSETHGPFTSAEIRSWHAAGYFAARPILLRDSRAPAPAPVQTGEPDDDDIFGSAGRYVPPPAAAGAAQAWAPMAAFPELAA